MYANVSEMAERVLFSGFARRYRCSSSTWGDAALGGASLCREASAEDDDCLHRATTAEADAVEGGLELADIFARHGAQLGPLSPHRERTVGAIVGCRTIRMGRHRRICESCDAVVDAFNSCRNRHCPKCQSLDEVRWLDGQMRDILPIPYHHVVFTVPQELHAHFRVAPRCAFGHLFAAVAETLQEVAARPSNLGARIGFMAVLHTWNQRLHFHPHVHCIVTGGGLSVDGERWVPAKPNFLFSVQVLSLVFRGKLLRRFEQARENGDIALPADDASEARRRASRKSWSVYSKRPMGGPEQVLRYLGRYTHRIAISNSRLVALEDGQVTYRWRDRSDGNQVKLETIDAVEFCERFLQHVVPPGFQRIRHYGLLGNGVRGAAVSLCRERLGAPKPPAESTEETWWEVYEQVTGRELPKCPRCGVGRLVDDPSAWCPVRRRAGRSPPRIRARAA